MRANKFLRFFCISLLVIAAVFIGSIALLFTWLNENTVKKTIEDISTQSFGAQVIFGGPIQVKKLSTLHIELPEMRFVDLQTPEQELAVIDSAHIDVSLWSIILGAIHVESATINGLSGTLSIPSLSSDALFDSTFANIQFPDDLRVNALTLQNSELTLNITDSSVNRLYQLRNVLIRMDRLSPEVSTPFEISAQLHQLSGASSHTPASFEALDIPAPAEPEPVAEHADSVNVTDLQIPEQAALSAQGTLILSTMDRIIAMEQLSFSAETTLNQTSYCLVAKADRLRIKAQELSGNNLSASISRPQSLSGDIHLAAVDFRLRPHLFESPELRLSYTNQTDSRVDSLRMSSAVTVHFQQHQAQFEGFSAQVSVTGDPNLPQDFSASLSGFVHVDLSHPIAKLGLSGSFGTSPFSYNGTLTYKQLPVLRGELMIGELITAQVPTLASMQWMHMLDFEGPLRIGQIQWKKHTATQLLTQLQLRDGLARFNDLIINTANGRILGSAQLTQNLDWTFKGAFDGVSLENILLGFDHPVLISGIMSGPFEVAGTASQIESMQGAGNIRILRAAYHGLDAQRVRNQVLNPSLESAHQFAEAITPLDEITAELSLQDGTFSIRNMSARAVTLRVNSDTQFSLIDGSLSGTVHTSFVPMQGTPSIYISAQLAGTLSQPQWSFDWQKARNGLQRAQGNSVLPSPTAPAKQHSQKSLWQNVKEFFKF